MIDLFSLLGWRGVGGGGVLQPVHKELKKSASKLAFLKVPPFHTDIFGGSPSLCYCFSLPEECQHHQHQMRAECWVGGGAPKTPIILDLLLLSVGVFTPLPSQNRVAKSPSDLTWRAERIKKYGSNWSEVAFTSRSVFLASPH